MMYAVPGANPPKWVLKFPGVREVHPSWGSAHSALLTDLAWVAMDTDDERYWKAWDTARNWSIYHDEETFEVEIEGLGFTYGIYHIDREPT